jgi:DASS family divalent anion:Na+ symporter
LTGEFYDCKGGKESFRHSLEGFSSSVVWLIFAAFHLGKAVEVTKLGKRISLFMIRSFGQHVMGLAYAILISGTKRKKKRTTRPIITNEKKNRVTIGSICA